MHFIPSLDGMRGAAFVVVFMAHCGLDKVIPGGFALMTFFVLSGYLITTLLRLEHDKTGTISLRKFYLRRALRILPPFYIVLTLATLLTVAGVLRGELRPDGVLAQYLHYANYWIIANSFNGLAQGSGVYWSLALEEHFYLLFPLLYILLLPTVPDRRRQAIVLWSLCGLVLVWRLVLVLGYDADAERIFLGTDTRIDGILFGCALAVYGNPIVDGRPARERLWKYVLLPAGVLLLLVTFLWRDPVFRATLRYTLQPIALLPFFVVAMSWPTWGPMRFLNWRPVAFLGLISFALYLVHHIVIGGVWYHFPSWPYLVKVVFAFGVTFFLAYASYVFVERPLMRLRKRLKNQ